MTPEWNPHDLRGKPTRVCRIEYVTGDATSPTGEGSKVIAHVCNDVGGWGKGFVLALSRKWPAPESEYRRWYEEREENDFGLGSIQLVQVEDDIWVANMVAQHGLGRRRGVPPIRYDAVERCLEELSRTCRDTGASVHMPRIGCGLAGGRWQEIEPIIERTLVSNQVPVVVYDFG